MNIKVREVMVSNVISCQPHHVVDHVRGIMERNAIHALPVVGPEDQLLGIVSMTDLGANVKAQKPVSEVMTDQVLTVPAYDDVHVAARVMRNHRIHHVVVTHEGKVVGMLSSFDLLRLVEDHRFVMKNAPTPARTRPRRD